MSIEKLKRLLKEYDELELILAYPLSSENIFLKNACHTVVSKLDEYNLEKTGILLKRKVFYEEIQLGTICQYSFNIESNINQFVLENLLSQSKFLSALQAKLHEYGVKNFFSWCYKDSALTKIFINDGFNCCGEFPDLIENRIVERFYKKIENYLDSETQKHITISKSYIYESYEEVNPYGLDDSFGIFIHDGNKNIKAGIFGKIYKAENKGISHGDINCLWVDNSLRSKGFGKFLILETEKFLKLQSAKYIQLATNGFQAPGFYKKMGFDVVESCPHYYSLKEGNFSVFDCTKKL